VGDDGLRAPDRGSAGLLALTGLFASVAVCGIPGYAESATRIAAEVGVLAVVVGVIGFESTAGAGLFVVLSSLLSLNGFVEDRYGQLGWHPATDLRTAAVLCGAWVLAYAARRGVDQSRRHQARSLTYHAPHWAEELDPEDGDR
jgi:hypothetical protein